MGSYSTATQRSFSNSAPVLKDPRQNLSEETKSARRKITINFTIPWPFNIPATTEVASARISKNLAYFKVYYMLFLWAALFISLIPAHKLSLIILVLMTNVTVMYHLIQKALPDSTLLNSIDRRLVLSLLAFSTAFMVVVTGAGLHLLITVACTTTIMLGHAVLQISDGYVLANEEDPATNGEELSPVGDQEPADEKV
ncbi:hypothetical protein Droror1_Dr00013443 [Drosera rotundifolia]